MFIYTNLQRITNLMSFKRIGNFNFKAIGSYDRVLLNLFLTLFANVTYFTTTTTTTNTSIPLSIESSHMFLIEKKNIIILM